MDNDELLSRVCQLPEEFRRRGDMSMVDLIRECGYLRSSNTITEQRLEGYFQANPDAIEGWLLESMDQRCSPAWYFQQPSETTGQWIVGYLNRNGQTDGEVSYNDAARASAFFVKRWLVQLEDIANG